MLRAAQKQGRLPKGPVYTLLDKALQADIIAAADAALISQAEEAQNNAIRVDDFSAEELSV